MKMQCFLLLLLLVQGNRVELEDEYGSSFVPPKALTYVVLDNQSCALCNNEIHELVSDELAGLPMYTIIDTKQTRSLRFMELDRHADYFQLFQGGVLFPKPGSPSVKSHFGCGQEQTPFVVVIVEHDTLIFGRSYFQGSLTERTALFNQLHRMLEN
jgi:hypothetical protein